MTKRERLEREVKRREEWAAKAKAKSDAYAGKAVEMQSIIPAGQPIQFGHHSTKSDVAYRGKIWDTFGMAAKADRKAKHHADMAETAKTFLASVLDDDPDAIERLEQIAAADPSQARSAKKRIKAIREQREREAPALAAFATGAKVYLLRGWVGTKQNPRRWCVVRFPSYPGADTVKHLKAAGYTYSKGAWSGPEAQLPSCVADMAAAKEVAR